MTTTEFEAYKNEIANEIKNIKSVRVLHSINNIIKKTFPPQKADPLANAKISAKSLENLTVFNSPCNYTEEETRERVVAALDAYKEGIYYTSKKFKKESIRWAKEAYNDSQAILQFIGIRYSESDSWRFEALIDNAIEMIIYNTKVGRKEPKLADLCNGNIRGLNINKYYKLTYIDLPECVLILEIQNLTPLDSKLKTRRN